MTKHSDVAAKTAQAYKLYQKGHSIAYCARTVGVSYCSVLRHFRDRYDDSISRKKPRLSKKRICTVCGNRPTLQDEGKLTLTTSLIPGTVQKVCGDCLNPSEEEDIKNLRKEFFNNTNFYGNSEDRLNIPASVHSSKQAKQVQ